MTPQEIIKWLNICAADTYAEACKSCPYNKGDYEDGCGKLLHDAALLLSASYSGVTVTQSFPVEVLRK